MNNSGPQVESTRSIYVCDEMGLSREAAGVMSGKELGWSDHCTMCLGPMNLLCILSNRNTWRHHEMKIDLFQHVGLSPHWYSPLISFT
jgi:hypothetical protein